MEVTMRLGKEQAAGYVEDIETEAAVSPQAAPVTAAAPELVLAAEEPVAALPR
jgi:hypothetical protein